MDESKIVRDVYSVSPSDFFHLITGTGDQSVLAEKYLEETHHWDAGEQTILNDTKNLIKLHSLIQFVSQNNPLTHILIMCFASLFGVLLLARAIIPRSHLSSTQVFWIIFLFPNMLFWSSGILKEPLMIMGLGLIFYGLAAHSSFLKRSLFIIPGLLTLLLFKSYLLVILIPVALFLIIYHLLPARKLLGSLLITFLTLTLTSSLFTGLREKSVHYLTRKQFDFINVARGGLHANTDSTFYYFRPDQYANLQYKGDSVRLIYPTDALLLKHGQIENPVPVHLEPNDRFWHIYFMNEPSAGYIELTPINNSTAQLVKNIPEALLNVLIRPVPFDPGGILKFPAFIESVLIFLFLFIAIRNRRTLTDHDLMLIASIGIFMLLLAFLIGWTTPVTGAIVRYRIPVYLGFILISLIMIKELKFSKK